MHPLKSLLDSRPTNHIQPTTTNPAAASSQPPGRRDVAEATATATAGATAGADRPTVGVEVAPGFRVVAVQDPPTADGRPGAAHFADGLTLAERRQIVADWEWWDRYDARGKSKTNQQQNEVRDE